MDSGYSSVSSKDRRRNLWTFSDPSGIDLSGAVLSRFCRDNNIKASFRFSRKALQASSERDHARRQLRQFTIVNRRKFVADGALAVVTINSGRLDLMCPLFGVFVIDHVEPPTSV